MQLKQKITTTIGILGASALAVLGIIVYPSVRSIIKLENGISEEKLKIEQRYLQRQQIRNTLEGLGDAKKKVGGIGGIALKEGKELAFVNALEAVAADTQVEQDIALETANQKDLSKWERQIPLILNVKGPYESLLRYLSGIERLPYLVSAHLIQVTTEQSKLDNPKGIVSMRIQATVYWHSKNAPAFLAPPAE